MAEEMATELGGGIPTTIVDLVAGVTGTFDPGQNAPGETYIEVNGLYYWPTRVYRDRDGDTIIVAEPGDVVISREARKAD